MSVVELSRRGADERGVIRLTPEQEARQRITHLTQQLLTLQLREPVTTPAVIVMTAKDPDTRFAEEKPTIPYVPKLQTYIVDNRTGTHSVFFEETPIALTLIIQSVEYPKPLDGIKVEYTRRGVSQDYSLVDSITLLDGTPAPAATALALIGDGQALVTCLAQG